MKVRLAFTVNDEPVELLADDYKTLLEVLREDLGLTNTKHSCELGECSTCAVLVSLQHEATPILTVIEIVRRPPVARTGFSGRILGRSCPRKVKVDSSIASRRSSTYGSASSAGLPGNSTANSSPP